MWPVDGARPRARAAHERAGQGANHRGIAEERWRQATRQRGARERGPRRESSWCRRRSLGRAVATSVCGHPKGLPACSGSADRGGPHHRVARPAQAPDSTSCAALATTIASARRPDWLRHSYAVNIFARSSGRRQSRAGHIVMWLVDHRGHMTMWPSSSAVDRASATRCEVLAVATRRCGPLKAGRRCRPSATRCEVSAAATRRCGRSKLHEAAAVDVDRQRDRGRRSGLAGDVPERVRVERGYGDVDRARSGELMRSTRYRRRDRITSAPALGAKRALPQRGHAHAQLR